MGDMLSQDEIDALMGGGGGGGASTDIDEADSNSSPYEEVLTSEEKDILGEIGNITMGTSATTLFALLNQKVWITTPRVRVQTWKELAEGYEKPSVGIRVSYKEGLKGSNVLVLQDHDVKIISNLMMGGDGDVSEGEPLTEIDLSAISEAMNQMVGSSSTSLSSMIKLKVDIDTPYAFKMDFDADVETVEKDIDFNINDVLVCIYFKMEIGTLIDSEIVQIFPSDFAKQMVEMLKIEMMGGKPSDPAPTPSSSTPPVQPAPPTYQQMPDQQQYQQQYQQQMPMGQQMPPPMVQYPQMDPSQMYQQPHYQQPIMGGAHMNYPQSNVNVQPVQFQNFDVSSVMQQKENIGIIMDVPLEVTVELGRTRKRIREILEFSPGTIVELDKLAGEPIDILVNGKFVAKGEVVVIDENFGIRITDIVSVENRI